MDNLILNNTTKKNRSESFSVLFQTVKGFFQKLIGFFTVTEEERLQAGVDTGSKYRDE